MTFIDRVKAKIGRAADGAKNEVAAQREKAESDVAADAHVAGAREGSGDGDGHYVGRTTPAFDAEVQQSGAEARSEETRRSQ